MIFNPVRSGGGKEYKITAQSDKITLSVTKQKPGHVFQAQKPDTVKGTLKMTFKDPDTRKSATIQGTNTILSGDFFFVMPCADVTITF